MAIRITTLGRFAIERDCQPLLAARKDARKPNELLRLVIAGPRATISRLSQTLWPDTDGDVAKKAFDTTLHRLRKLLASDEAIVLRDGVVELNLALVWTDVAALEHVLGSIERVLGAPLGSWLAGRFHPDRLQRAFALFLFLVGVRMLFPLPPITDILFGGASPYEAAADGNRFLVLAASQQSSPLTVIVNWHALMKSKTSGQ